MLPPVLAEIPSTMDEDAFLKWQQTQHHTVPIIERTMHGMKKGRYFKKLVAFGSTEEHIPAFL